MLKIAWSPVYKYDLPEGHRFPMEKYELLPEQLMYEGTVDSSNFYHPPALNRDEILLTHKPSYYDSLLKGQLSRKEQRRIGFPVTRKLVERGRYIAGGTLKCIDYALEYGISMNIAGGTHHAYPDRGEGFCVFNDFALASNIALQRKILSKILIVDLDVHQGNGNAFIFQNEDRVFTFSMHGAKNYPLKKEKSDLDIPLPDGLEDRNYLRILNETLPKLMDDVEPDLVFYQAGVDILESDKLGRLKVSKNGVLERDRFVLETCKKNGVPLVASMGGGYPHKLSDLIDAHANTYRVATELFF
ncbi:MAG: histone deacetylase [Saprospirales bacterium]|nr:MAG: histone deacetylase [Saprospirales bacterium]